MRVLPARTKLKALLPARSETGFERDDVLSVGSGHLLATSLGNGDRIGVQSYVPRWGSTPPAVEVVYGFVELAGG